MCAICVMINPNPTYLLSLDPEDTSNGSVELNRCSDVSPMQHSIYFYSMERESENEDQEEGTEAFPLHIPTVGGYVSEHCHTDYSVLFD